MIFEVRDIPQREYRADKRLSASDCKMLLTDPFAFKMGIKDTKTDALRVGSLIHNLVLEPENFNRDFIVSPNLDLRKKDDKVLKEEIEHKALVENKILITEREFEESSEVANAVLESDIGCFFKNGFAEKSYFGEVFGKPCKGRPDYFLNADGGYIIDLKTTQKGGTIADKFSKTCASYYYHLQARFYLELLGAESFLFVVVEKEPPYNIGVFQLGEASLEVGEKKIKEAFEIYENLEKIDRIKRTKSGEITQVIDIPNYAFYS